MAPLSLSQVYAHQREISNAIAGKHAGSGLYSPRPHGAIAKPPRAAAKTKAFQHRLLMLENNAGKQRFLADTRSSSSASSTSPVSSTDIACRSTIDSLLSSDATEGSPTKVFNVENSAADSSTGDATSGSPTPPEGSSSFAVGSAAVPAQTPTTVVVKIEPAPDNAGMNAVGSSNIPVSAQVAQDYDFAPVTEHILPDGSTFVGTKAAWLERLFLQPEWTEHWLENAFTPSRLQSLRNNDPSAFDDTALVVQAIAYGQE